MQPQAFEFVLRELEHKILGETIEIAADSQVEIFVSTWCSSVRSLSSITFARE